MNSPFHSFVFPFRLMVATGMLLTWVDCLVANESKAPHLVPEEVQVPPEWALLQQLRNLSSPTLERMVLLSGGMHGPEWMVRTMVTKPTIIFRSIRALGGPREILDLSTRLWNTVTRQFTKYGQVHREFDAYCDWMHQAWFKVWPRFVLKRK